MALSIAVAGKGGTGKTTFASLLVRALVERGVRPVLAVDADPNANLAEALGVEPGLTLAEIRERGSTPEGSPSSGIGRVRAVEDEVQRALAEAQGFDLLTMGRPEGPRCYCAVNHLLRQSLDTLGRNYAAVVLDNEAGMEHLSRRTTNEIDFLIAVLNPTLPSLRAVRRILDLPRYLRGRLGQRVVLATRFVHVGVPEPLSSQIAVLGVERLPDVPQDDAVERAGAVGRDVFGLDAGSPALEAVRRSAARLCSTLVSSPV
jgi:CO dehydrogenase maturation factor